jgi:hypothetical protein
MVTPIFVLGSPRSGTTMLGEYVGSSEDVFNSVEYSGFYFSEIIAPDMMKSAPTPVKDDYLESLKDHAFSFIEKKTLEAGNKFFMDSTPWNLLFVESLAKKYPNAIFVCTLRHFSGVIQSLERSYQQGYKWAGANIDERISLYKEFYDNVSKLPKERIIFFDYDQFCSSPEDTLIQFDNDFSKLVSLNNEMDKKSFAKTHATKKGEGQTRKAIASLSSKGELKFNIIPSYNKETWDHSLNQVGVDLLTQTWEGFKHHNIEKDFLKV